MVKTLEERGTAPQVLDSDALRDVLTPDPTYSDDEREWFYMVVAYIARLLTQNGICVVIAATAHRRQYRDYARRMVPRFAEVYVRCSPKTCMEPDEKGIYARAMAGRATTVPGLQVPYEPPESPAVVVDTELLSAEQGVQRIMDHLEQISFLGAR